MGVPADRERNRRQREFKRGWGPSAPLELPLPSPRTGLRWSERRTAERAPRLRPAHMVPSSYRERPSGVGGLRVDEG